MAHISDCKTFFQNFMDLENICCRFYGRGYFFFGRYYGLKILFVANILDYDTHCGRFYEWT